MNTLSLTSRPAEVNPSPACNAVLAHFSTWNRTLQIIYGSIAIDRYDILAIPNFHTNCNECSGPKLLTIRAAIPPAGVCPRDTDRQWESLFRSIVREADNSYAGNLAFCNFCPSAEPSHQQHIANIATESIVSIIHSLHHLNRIDIVATELEQADIYARALDQAASLVSAGA